MKKMIRTKLPLSLLLAAALIAAASGTAAAKTPAKQDSAASAKGFAATWKDKLNTRQTEAEPEAEPAAPVHALVSSTSLWDTDPDTWKTYYSMDTAYVYLQDEDAETYPELAEALSSMAAEMSTKNDDAFLSMSTEARQFADESGQGIPFSSVDKADIMRADSNYFSIRFYNESYSGGAHGYYMNAGCTFDTKTGKELALTDVVTDLDDLKAAIIPLLEEKYKEEIMVDLKKQFKEYDADSFCWWLTPYGMELCFNPYELAAYASGQQFVLLPYGNYPKLFTEGIENACEAYAVPFNTGYIPGPMNYDVRHDGKMNVIQFIPRYMEGSYSEYQGYTVRIDDRTFEMGEDDYYYNLDSVHLVHTAAGKDLLWFVMQTDNDYHYGKAVDITGGNAKDAGTFYGSYYSSFFDDAENEQFWTFSDALTDPGKFRMLTIGDVLSTYAVWQDCYAGVGGLPESEDLFYYTNPDSAPTLKLKKNYEAQEVNEAGKKLGKLKLKAGTELTIERTDNKDFADLRIARNGRLVRITLNHSSDEHWGWTTDGEDPYELFDDMMYAG